MILIFEGHESSFFYVRYRVYEAFDIENDEREFPTEVIYICNFEVMQFPSFGM